MENITKIKNINGTLVGRDLKGYPFEVDASIIEERIKELDKVIPKNLSINDIANFLKREQFRNLLIVDNFEMYL